MAKSWELTDEQKQEILEKQREIAAEYDPETGKKKGAENVGESEDPESIDPRERQRPEGNENDENIR